MANVPFLNYKILPSQAIVRENVRPDHIKEDIDALVHALSPIMFLTKSGVPKPPSLGQGVIQPLADKFGTLNLLRLLGWLPNNHGDYVFVTADSSEEKAQREAVAEEFRHFTDELKKMKEQDVSAVESSFAIITTVPFSSYHVIPADQIVRNNVRLDNIRADLDSLIHVLTPVLYVTKTGVPKPPFLDPSVIENLMEKPGTTDLLPLFGCVANHRGDYVFLDEKTSNENNARESAANEFRHFYEELKKVKNESIQVMEYYLQHPNKGATQIQFD